MLERKTIDLNYRVKVTQYGHEVEVKEKSNYNLVITLPCILGK